MSESMIERMARAVYAGNQWKRWVEETQTWYHIPWEELADSERDERLTDQRNAIAGIESAGYVIVPREPTEAMLAQAIKDCTDEFQSPVCSYIGPEAKFRWQEANPGWLAPEADHDWYDTDESKDDLVSYKIIARAVLRMISPAKETP